jgi:hypothetical protein
VPQFQKQHGSLANKGRIFAFPVLWPVEKQCQKRHIGTINRAVWHIWADVVRVGRDVPITLKIGAFGERALPVLIVSLIQAIRCLARLVGLRYPYRCGGLGTARPAFFAICFLV